MISNKDSAVTLFEVLAERRLRRPPSQRDQEIAAAVRVQGRRQVEVAAQFGLSRRRVSQICRKIEEWHANVPAWERGEADEESRPQTDRFLQRDQLTEIYGAALRAYARSEQPLVTRRSGKRGEQRWSDRSQRQQRLDTGSLRVALKAIEMQWKLADRPFKAEDEGKDEKGRLKIVLSWIVQALEFVRKDAETRGAVPKTPGGPKAAVEQCLREFLGVPEEGVHSRDPWSRSGSPRPDVGEGEAPAEPDLQSDEREGVGSLWPNATLDHGNAAPAKDSRPLGASNSSMGSVWEAPSEALPATPAAATSDVAASTCSAAAAAGSVLGSAPKIEMGNVSQELPREGVGSLWPNTTLDHGNAAPAKDSRPLGAPTAPKVRSDAEEERLALAELQRSFEMELTSALADHSIPNILAEGQSNLVLQGYTREQRQALLGWQRVMDRRKREKGETNPTR